MFENTYNMCGVGLEPGNYFTRSFIFYDFFYTLGTSIFRNTWECSPENTSFFFYCNVSSKNLPSLFLCFFKKSDALYLFPTNWLLSIVLDKFTITEFAPFSLVTKGAFVTFGTIYFCVKSHSFILSLIPCCPLSFKTERTIPLIFALAVATCFAY